jgi:hypothetical protein
MGKTEEFFNKSTNDPQLGISALRLLSVVFLVVVSSVISGLTNASDSNSVKPSLDYKNTKLTGDWGD